MSLKISSELIDYFAPLRAVAPGKDIAALAAKDFLGIMSLGEDNGLYLFARVEEGERTAPFTKLKIDANVAGFAAMRLKGTKTFVFSYIKGGQVFLAVTETPRQLTAASFSVVNTEVKGYGACSPLSVSITGLDGKAKLSVAMQDQGGRIRRLTVNCANNRAAAFPLGANFSKIDCEILGRSAGERVDGIYTLGEYSGAKQLLYTPLYNLSGDTPPAPKRLLPPQGGGDKLSVCPVKQGTGTNLFVAGGGGISFYPYKMQYDCEHFAQPEPVTVAAGKTEISGVRFMASFVADKKIFVYVLADTGRLYYAFADYDYNTDEAGKFSELLLAREDCLYFRASEGRMFVCEKARLLFGKRDEETGSYRFKEAHFDAELGQYTQFRGLHTKIRTEKPETELTLRAERKINAYVNGRNLNFEAAVVKSDLSCIVDIVQYAEGLAADSWEVTCGGETIKVSPAEVYKNKLSQLATAEGIKKAVICAPAGQTTPLAGENPDNETLVNAAAAVSALINSPLLAGSRCLEANRAPVFAHIISAPANSAARMAPRTLQDSGVTDFFNEVKYTLEDIFNWVGQGVDGAVRFAAKIAGSIIEFTITIGKEVIKFQLDTVWKALETIGKILSYVGIPLDKLLDFLKYVFNPQEIGQERDYLKEIIKNSLERVKPEIDRMSQKIDKALSTAEESISDWAKIKIPENAETPPPISDSLFAGVPSNYLFDLIWRRFDITHLFSTTVDVKPPQKLTDAVLKMQKTFGAEALLNDVKNVTDGLAAWVKGQSDFSVQTMLDSLKALGGAIAIAGIRLARDFIAALFELFANLLDFIWEAANTKIHIPIISDILPLLGIKDFSIADLILLPGAAFASFVKGCLGLKEDAPDVKPTVPLANAVLETAEVQEIHCVPTAKNTKAGLVTIHSALFILETAETIFSGLSMLKDFSEWSQDNPKAMAVISGTFTLFDFGLCYWSGSLYSPMSEHKISATSVYGDLWYAKSAVSLVLLSGICGYINCKYKDQSSPVGARIFKYVINGVYATLAVTAIIFEIMALCKAGEAAHLTNESQADFEKDRKLFRIQTCAYIGDDIRNIIDGAYGIYETYKEGDQRVGPEGESPEGESIFIPSNFELIVLGIRAVLSEGYACAQIYYFSVLLSDPSGL